LRIDQRKQLLEAECDDPQENVTNLGVEPL